MPSTSAPLLHDMWDYNDPAATERRFRDLLPTYPIHESLDQHIQLLTQIARAQGLQRQFKEAHTTLDQAQGLLQDLRSVGQVRLSLERGRVLRSSKHRQESLPFFLEAWKLAQELELDFYAVDAAHMLGIAEETPDTQMEWNLKALSVAEQSHEHHARQWLGSLYNNIGWTYHGAGQYEEAQSMFEKALTWRNQDDPTGTSKKVRIARWCVARGLRSLNRLEESLSQQQALLEDYLSDPTTQEMDLGYVYEELGECLWSMGQQKEAQPHLKKAHSILSQDLWLQDNEAERLESLRQRSMASTKHHTSQT
ncbi:MAG: tetratricopeptide repeat protein [Deltaproteobacteria bacterium]|nr:MAG: tetratricopeptide repeat protein [Deltaproteobacteria bacterium]